MLIWIAIACGVALAMLGFLVLPVRHLTRGGDAPHNDWVFHNPRRAVVDLARAS